MIKNSLKLNVKNILFGVAAATAFTLVGSANASAHDIQTIKSGDNLSKLIETKYGYNDLYSNIEKVKKLNNISNANLIYVGDQINLDINSVSSATPQVSAPVKPVVKPVVKPSAQSSSSVQSNVPDQKQASTYKAPVQQPAQTQSTQVSKPAQNIQSSQNTQTVNTVSSAEEQAKEAVAYRESRGSYTVVNGSYIGKYQLSSSYLNGDYSPANQEKVAQEYVNSRYGSWTNALAHENAYGWY